MRATLDAVGDSYPGFLDLVLEDGTLSKFVKIFHNGCEVDDATLDKSVGAMDELEIVAAIAGGLRNG